jgi:hypothetical protein
VNIPGSKVFYWRRGAFRRADHSALGIDGYFFRGEDFAAGAEGLQPLTHLNPYLAPITIYRAAMKPHTTLSIEQRINVSAKSAGIFEPFPDD